MTGIANLNGGGEWKSLEIKNIPFDGTVSYKINEDYDELIIAVSLSPNSPAYWSPFSIPSQMVSDTQRMFRVGYGYSSYMNSCVIWITSNTLKVQSVVDGTQRAADVLIYYR